MADKRRRKRIPRDTKEAIAERDGHVCRYCGTNIGPFHIDHVYPDSKGGVTAIANLVLACEDCNSKKSNVIGMWPKPIGYFNGRKKISPPSGRKVVVGLFFLTPSMTILPIGLVAMGLAPPETMMVSFVGGVLIVTLYLIAGTMRRPTTRLAAPKVSESRRRRDTERAARNSNRRSSRTRAGGI